VQRERGRDRNTAKERSRTAKSRYDWARQVLATEGEVTDARFCRR
jgi:hypothetical protein